MAGAVAKSWFLQMSKPETEERLYCPECDKPWEMDLASWPVRVLCKHCHWGMDQKSYSMGQAEWKWELLVKRTTDTENRLDELIKEGGKTE